MMIAGKETKMAKVELNGVEDGGSANVGIRDTRQPATAGEYVDKTWDEYVTFNLIEELIKKRKVVQRKLDAARKRFKRLANRLNMIEKSWEKQWVSA